MEELIGRQIGHYRVIRELGAGGFADVYLVEHVYLNRLAAIKLLRASLADGDKQSFHDEARIIAQLEHPHIVRVLDFGIENNSPYLVMDYAPNGTLRQRHPTGTRVSLPLAVMYVKQIASALQYAHARRLIHRDIKPENILLGRNDDLLLSDFGAALLTRTSLMLKTQNIVGTVSYMSPEQLRGRPVAASDQYALGVVVYEWLCGDYPFQGTAVQVQYLQQYESPLLLRMKMPTIPSSVEQVVMKALAKQPEQRFENIQAFAEALERASQQMQASPLILRGNMDDSSYQASSATAISPAPLPLPPTMVVPPQAIPLPVTMINNAAPAKPLHSRRAFLGSIAGLAVIGGGGLTFLLARSKSPIIAKPSVPTTIPIKKKALHTYYHQDEVFTAAWSPDGSLIASAGGNRYTRQGDIGIHVWTAFGKYDTYKHLGHSRLIRMVVWSPPDGRRIASASEDGTVKVWDALDGASPLNYTHHKDKVMALAWSPDGARIASTSLDLTVQIWDANTGTSKLTYNSYISGARDTQNVTPVAWSPDGRMLASTNGDRMAINVWDATTGATLHVFHSTSVIGSLIWSPDSKYIATGSYNPDDSVRIWNVNTENNVPIFSGTGNPVYTVAWSPDSNFIAAGYHKNEVKIWDLTLGKQILTYLGHNQPVMSVQWSPNGKYIASCGFDKTVQVWEPFP